jgi:hypothetical protein
LLNCLWIGLSNTAAQWTVNTIRLIRRRIDNNRPGR